MAERTWDYRGNKTIRLFRACILFASDQAPKNGKLGYPRVHVEFDCFYREMFQEAGKRLVGKAVYLLDEITAYHVKKVEGEYFIDEHGKRHLLSDIEKVDMDDKWKKAFFAKIYKMAKKGDKYQAAALLKQYLLERFPGQLGPDDDYYDEIANNLVNLDGRHELGKLDDDEILRLWRN